MITSALSWLAVDLDTVGYWIVLVLVAALLLLLLLKERVSGSLAAPDLALSRRLSLAIYPLLAAYVGYVLLKLVQAIR